MAIETEPALSPDGEKLAYISDRTGTPQIYLLNLSTKKTTRLTKKGNYNSSPSWSPDGRHLVFSLTRGGSSQIYMVNSDGTGTLEQLTKGGIHYSSPSWSPL